MTRQVNTLAWSFYAINEELCFCTALGSERDAAANFVFTICAGFTQCFACQLFYSFVPQLPQNPALLSFFAPHSLQNLPPEICCGIASGMAAGSSETEVSYAGGS